jgi:hypothetical protein
MSTSRSEEKEFLVELKRVVFVTARVKGTSAAAVRKKVNEEGPHEYMLDAEIGGTDTTIIASIKPSE